MRLVTDIIIGQKNIMDGCLVRIDENNEKLKGDLSIYSDTMQDDVQRAARDMIKNIEKTIVEIKDVLSAKMEIILKAAKDTEALENEWKSESSG